MAKKNVVVEKTVEVKAEEQKPVEMTAPATPAENVEPAPQPAPDKPEADKSEPPKTETKKSTKKAAKKKSAPKDKSEKDETAFDKPAENAQKPKFKISKRDKEMAEKRKLLAAAGLSETAIEAAIVAQFGTKADKSKKEVETSARDAMFPASFEVNGIKFRRLELTAQKISTVSGKEIDSFMPAILDAKNNEPDGCALCLAFQWSEEMLAPSGAKGNGKSDYEKSTNVTPPAKFPCDLDMCIIDAVLNVRVEKLTVHSIYTEFPGFVEFSVFNKRTKNGWFDCFNAPTEIYLADFTEFDFDKNGVFVDLYDK